VATIADLVIKLSANTAPAEKDISSFSGKVSRGFGKALLPAVGVLGGLGVVAKKATDAARDLGESQNAVNVVFGKGAKQIHAFAKVADKEAGLSMKQLNELVTPIGAMLQNTGDSAEEAAEKSIVLARRAADMASVFNVDVKEALAAIQAGLRGEADPLERFGVGLSDAAVKAQVLEAGLAKTEKQITNGDKATGRYALILAQTTKLHGDFKNTSDSVANSARINAAAQENLQAKIGTGLLPVMQMYQGIVSKATGFMAGHTTGVKVAAVVLGGLAATVIAVNGAMMAYRALVIAVRAATALWTAAQWLLNAALTANPIGAVVVAIAALAAGVLIAYNRSETFRKIVDRLREAFEGVVSFVTKHWGTISTILKNSPFVVTFRLTRFYIEKIIEGVKWLIDNIGKLGGILGKVGGVLGKVPGFEGGVRNFGGGLAVVGEGGPELVNLPRGADVFSNDESRRMLDGSGGPALHVENLTVNDPVDVELLAARVSRRLALR
jgi:hypothetical protein